MTRKVIVQFDDHADSEEAVGDLFRLVSFGRRHVNHASPDSVGYGPDGTPTLGLRAKLRAGTAFECSYYEHGACVWSLRGEGPACRFDSVGLAGLLILSDEGKKALRGLDARRAAAESFLRRYTAWCNGEVFFLQLQDEDGDILDSVGGIVGAHEAETAAKEYFGGDCELVWR